MYAHYRDFANHELVSSRLDSQSGLVALIALHNTHRGPAIGGCRMSLYPDTDAAVTDVLRLSRGMTYKSAIAGIPYGGGKAVVVADPRHNKTRVLLHAMGDFVESLAGRYITSFDSGTTLEDVRTIGERTQYTAGTLPDAGNASISTARGVFECIKAGVRLRLGRSSLEGVCVAVQGLGNVGGRLSELLHNSGASLILADTDADLAARMAADLGARVVDPRAIYKVPADVFCPCALGGVLSASSIAELGSRLVVGGANNQLARPDDDRRLMERDILYCPDYLANAGGIVDLHYQRSGWSQAH